MTNLTNHDGGSKMSETEYDPTEVSMVDKIKATSEAGIEDLVRAAAAFGWNMHRLGVSEEQAMADSVINVQDTIALDASLIRQLGEMEARVRARESKGT